MSEVINVWAAKDSEVKGLRNYFDEKRKQKLELSAKLINENKDLLLEYYDKYNNDDPIFNNDRMLWNWVPAIIKAAGFKGKISAEPLYDFYMDLGLRCLYETKGHEDNLPYRRKFETYNNVGEAERKYMTTLTAKFEQSGYKVVREFAIGYEFETGVKNYKFIDLIASRIHVHFGEMILVEGKKNISDIDVDQLDFYELLLKKLLEKYGKQYYVRSVFYVDQDINYVPVGNYKYPVYSINNFQHGNTTVS